MAISDVKLVRVGWLWKTFLILSTLVLVRRLCGCYSKRFALGPQGPGFITELGCYATIPGHFFSDQAIKAKFQIVGVAYHDLHQALFSGLFIFRPADSY